MPQHPVRCLARALASGNGRPTVIVVRSMFFLTGHARAIYTFSREFKTYKRALEDHISSVEQVSPVLLLASSSQAFRTPALSSSIMFARLPAVFLYMLVTLGLLVAALPGGGGGHGTTAPPVTTVTVTAPATTTTITGESCTTGDQQCCNKVTTASDQSATTLLGLLGIVLDDLNVLVGLDCVSILGGGSCNSQVVCCENNHWGGLINIGCTPINIL
ncbi:fungal hydrophobin-domain-containing protein [Schizophyllum amplum]|uniref:Hydrophobin n=1 Tax=Schizophyllum amplum TaxID=97359 RepID=A0A550CPE8_9AGAR|nr:fungal hydrophobin-domain-containing protein [Auriculariopsis ampla]